MKYIFPDTMWAGSDLSLEIARQGYDSIMAGTGTITSNQSSAAPADANIPYNFSLQGNIGVIMITGSLINIDNEYARYRGMTTYPDVRRAFHYAAMNADVQHILMLVESGGGAVNGVADTSAMITMINDKVKPVTAYTDGLMASAAYWLGASAGTAYSSMTSVVGSVGVISTHMEISKMMKDQGVGVTVVRSGEFKALANMHEPLSEVALKQMTSQLDQAYGVFATHMADRRGVPMTTFEKSMGQGREFFGEAAKTAGMVDGITTLDALMSKINAGLIDKAAKKAQTKQNFQLGQTMKLALTDQQVAAINAGLPVDLDAATIAAAAAATQAAADAAAATAAVAVATPAAETAQVPLESAVVAMLQTQNKEANASILSLSIELNASKDKLTSFEAATPGLTAVVVKSLVQMKIALGLPSVDMTSMSPAVLLAEHTRVSEAFTTAFKSGGVAAVTVEVPKAEKQHDPLYKQRVDAVRAQRNK